MVLALLLPLSLSFLMLCGLRCCLEIVRLFDMRLVPIRPALPGCVFRGSSHESRLHVFLSTKPVGR